MTPRLSTRNVRFPEFVPTRCLSGYGPIPAGTLEVVHVSYWRILAVSVVAEFFGKPNQAWSMCKENTAYEQSGMSNRLLIQGILAKLAFISNRRRESATFTHEKLMRTLITCLAIMTLTTSAHADIFGISTGQSLNDLSPQDVDEGIPRAGIARRYKITPPKPNPYFVHYEVYASSGAGVCAIYALSANRPEAELSKAQGEFNELKTVLDAKYGEGNARMGLVLFMDQATKIFGVHTVSYGASWFGDIKKIEKNLAHLSLVSVQNPVGVGVVYEFDNFHKCANSHDVPITDEGL
ncbi:hypothetical protein J2T09_004897 [Neorhizobium huautlense]|uniref:Uncharacterized protein n=1 Tax=Neorhizobium huautlense TaxID=67774 RepID=A0ABT9Q064_9HYPH|nr:hypothetical protein [Neorhizobium huautlense]MDP9840117.1 hypothetical protein [Neorhizobium huautlense]